MDPENKKILIGINGFGTMGRIIYRLLAGEKNIQVAKINDLAPRENLEYLLRNNSVHGRRKDFSLEGVEVTQEKEAVHLDWRKFGVDIVIDSTPHLRSYQQLKQHLKNGANYVIRTSPIKKDKRSYVVETQTIVRGVNGGQLDLERYKVFSLASCTTNCLASLVKGVLEYLKKFGNDVKSMDFVTVHAYTAGQLIKDGLHRSDLRRGRGVDNIIETETRASSQITLLFPELREKIFGSAYRVPVSDGSLLELKVETEQEIHLSLLNQYLEELSTGKMKGILSYEKEALVSGDCIDDPHSCLYLERSAKQLDRRRVRLVALYDNEFGYSNRVVDLVKEIERRIPGRKKGKFPGEFQAGRIFGR